jgi:hypothetical protein
MARTLFSLENNVNEMSDKLSNKIRDKFSGMADTNPRRAIIITYRKSFRRWRRANLSVEMSIELALADAREKHPLTDEQQRDVDEFLKVKVSEKKKGKTKPGGPINADFDVS